MNICRLLIYTFLVVKTALEEGLIEDFQKGF
jgi:hypothetical protein